MYEAIVQGLPLDDQVKKIFTDATGMQMVGLVQTDPRSLLTYHEVGNPKQLIELKWVVQSARECARQLEEIRPQTNIT